MGRDYRIHLKTGMVEGGAWAPWPWPKKLLHWFLGYGLGFVAYGWSLARYSPRKERQKVVDAGEWPDKYAFPARLTMAHLHKIMKHSEWMPQYWEPIYQWLAREDLVSGAIGAEALLPRVEAAVERSRQHSAVRERENANPWRQVEKETR